MRKLFCIIGLTGSGKSTFYNYILKIFNSNIDDGLSELKPLVYHTTRKKRENEEDGIDYIFSKHDEFFKLCKQYQVIEHRHYFTQNNGTAIYFTTKSDIEDVDSNSLITVSSIEQVANYIKWNDENPDDAFELFIIKIDCGLKTRFKRIADERCKNDADIYELCRRILQEKEDWSIEKDIMDKIDEDHYISIDNNDISSTTNSIDIIGWIDEGLKRI